MGVAKNISHIEYPVEANYLNREVIVCFNYDSSMSIEGCVIRDDATEPFITIIKLSDGRHVLATECQYQLKSLRS